MKFRCRLDINERYSAGLGDLKGLDHELKQNVMDVILVETKGKTALFTTHDEEESRYMADEIIITDGLPFRINKRN